MTDREKAEQALREARYIYGLQDDIWYTGEPVVTVKLNGTRAVLDVPLSMLPSLSRGGYANEPESNHAKMLEALRRVKEAYADMKGYKLGVVLRSFMPDLIADLELQSGWVEGITKAEDDKKEG